MTILIALPLVSCLLSQCHRLAPGGGEFRVDRCCDTSVSDTGDPTCFANAGASLFSSDTCCPPGGFSLPPSETNVVAPPTVCRDDMNWGGPLGDCTTYAPGERNAAHCDTDGALQVCLVSCGVCDVSPDPTCWAPPEYTFQICCGGANGNPNCWDSAGSPDGFCACTAPHR